MRSGGYYLMVDSLTVVHQVFEGQTGFHEGPHAGMEGRPELHLCGVS